MIKRNLKTMIITSIIIFLPMLLGILMWDKLPEQIPTHWNMAGQVDGWSSKPFAVFGLPAILFAAQLLCLFSTAVDPKNKNISDKVLQVILWIMPVLSIALGAATYVAALGKDVQMEAITPILLGLVFTIVGNYMPKCKQSYTIGIKIPWTLNSEENWNKTHRFAGYLWTVSGIVIMLSGFIGILWIAMGAALVMAFVPVIYSYILYRKGI